MKIKEGVVMTGLQLQMRDVLIAADQIWKDAGQELVVTEGTGGTHSAGSLHYYGYALDLRSRDFSLAELNDVVDKLNKALGSYYNVVVHNTHIHVEYDKAKYL